MITVTVEKRYGRGGHTTVRSRISAPSIGEALRIAGQGASVVFPIDAETFFAGTPLAVAEEEPARPAHPAA